MAIKQLGKIKRYQLASNTIPLLTKTMYCAITVALLKCHAIRYCTVPSPVISIYVITLYIDTALYKRRFNLDI